MSNRAFPVASVVATLFGFATIAACAQSTSAGDGAPAASSHEDAAAPLDAASGDDTDGGAQQVPADAGDAGGGESDAGSFGITSCQPAFEHACKPPITFVNGDPDNRGKVFTDAVPDVQAAEQGIACTVCSMLYRDPSEIPSDKHPATISIVLDTHGGVAQSGGDTIQFDLDYIETWADQPADLVKQEMLGVLQHETVHLYQNYGNTGTGEGLADLVRARTGYYQKNRWQAGEGTWKDPYTASGNFYSWLTGPCSFHSTFYPGHDLDFPYKLNKVLAGQADDAAYTAVSGLIQSTFGKSVDDLWTAYQATAF